ncbi:MAG: amidohydrolase family protein [Acidobacteriota bacterium]|nr:amidohydrolase family protein [Acidobacteriota bacterium]
MSIFNKIIKSFRMLRAENSFRTKRAVIIALLTATATAASFSVSGQKTVDYATVSIDNAAVRNGSGENMAGKLTPTIAPSQQQLQLTPLADYHTHLWSLNARSSVMTPLLPAVELPDDLKRLLKEREQLVREKNPSVLARIYTEDAMVLDAAAPIWLRGERAVSFVANSLGSYPLIPQGYKLEGSAGYIIGTYTEGEGTALEHVSNFSLFIRKGADGKWRIAGETFTLKGPPVAKAATAEQLVAKLDAAGIKRAAVLSVAFWFGSAFRKTKDEYAKVKAENDWLAQQVARFPERLVGFCSFNPLKDYALEELDRCAKNPHFKGLKLHFGNSGVNVLDAQHVEKLRAVFRAANEKRFPIIAHLWITGKYGAEHSEAFLNRVVSAAPDIPIQIAHMAASGPDYHSDDALEVYARAAVANNPLMKNLYFDVASMVTPDSSPKTLELVARRLRELGLRRVLFASDYAPGGNNAEPLDAWNAFRRLPLKPEEFNAVAGSVAPYMR